MRQRTLLLTVVAILSAVVFGSAQTQSGIVISNDRVKVTADSLTTRPIYSGAAARGLTSYALETTLTGHVIIESNGVTVVADRAVLRDGEYHVEGNVRVRVPTP